MNLRSWETTIDVQRHVVECILYLKHYSEKGVLLLDNMISDVINDWGYCIHAPLSPMILSRYDKKYDMLVVDQVSKYCNDFISKFCLNESYRIDEKDGKSADHKGLLATEFMNIISDFIHEWKDVEYDKTYSMFSFIFNLNYGRAGVYSS